MFQMFQSVQIEEEGNWKSLTFDEHVAYVQQTSKYVYSPHGVRIDTQPISPVILMDGSLNENLEKLEDECITNDGLIRTRGRGDRSTKVYVEDEDGPERNDASKIGVIVMEDVNFNNVYYCDVTPRTCRFRVVDLPKGKRLSLSPTELTSLSSSELTRAANFADAFTRAMSSIDLNVTALIETMTGTSDDLKRVSSEENVIIWYTEDDGQKQLLYFNGHESDAPTADALIRLLLSSQRLVKLSRDTAGFFAAEKWFFADRKDESESETGSDSDNSVPIEDDTDTDADADPDADADVGGDGQGVGGDGQGVGGDGQGVGGDGQGVGGDGQGVGGDGQGVGGDGQGVGGDGEGDESDSDAATPPLDHILFMHSMQEIEKTLMKNDEINRAKLKPMLKFFLAYHRMILHQGTLAKSKEILQYSFGITETNADGVLGVSLDEIVRGFYIIETHARSQKREFINAMVVQTSDRFILVTQNASSTVDFVSVFKLFLMIHRPYDTLQTYEYSTTDPNLDFSIAPDDKYDVLGLFYRLDSSPLNEHIGGNFFHTWLVNFAQSCVENKFCTGSTNLVSKRS